MVSLEERLGYKFRNSLLLGEALTHPSLAYESAKPHFDNQRLEFLGDAVLQLILTQHLFETFPGFAEGQMTKLRTRIVSRPALEKFAKKIRLGDYLLLGRGEESSGGRSRSSTLADAYESVIGAIYLDSNLETVRDIVLSHCKAELKIDDEDDPLERNPKGQLQELLQQFDLPGPSYTVIDESGPDHDKTFVSVVSWNGAELAKGKGSSKKISETAAAKNALSNDEWRKVVPDSEEDGSA